MEDFIAYGFCAKAVDDLSVEVCSSYQQPGCCNEHCLPKHTHTSHEVLRSQRALCLAQVTFRHMLTS